MGLTDWLRRNGDVVEKVLGPLDDLIVKSNAQDAFKELGKFEKRYTDWLNLRSLNKKLDSYQINEDDINSLVKSKYTYNPGFEEDETIKGAPVYQEYQKAPTQNGQAGDYLAYLQASGNTDEINRLKGLGYLNEELIKPSQDDISNHIANKLLNADELSMYNKLRGEDFNPDIHNYGLRDLVMKNKNRLISSGSVGNDLAEELIQRAGLIQMPDEKPENPLIRFDEKNNLMIGYDNQGNIKFTRKYADDPKKEEKNSFGSYGTMQWEDILKLQPNEVYQNFGAFSSEMQDKLKQQYPTLFADDPETGSTGHRYKGPGKIKTKDEPLNPNDKVMNNLLSDLNEVKIKLGNKWIDEPGDDEKYEKGTPEYEQYELQKKYTTIKNSLQNMGINDPDYAAVKYGTSSIDEKKKKKDVLGNIKNISNYRNQIQNWQGKIEEMWNRYDLTPEDWIGEMEKHHMFDNSGDEDYYEALKDWFRDKTGKNLEDYGNFE
ncbi:MAG: hypothetical protein IT280_13375 [Ignavibacteria bacterium]|nr:hypothetical protein [Ignavibacteria bacterium]